MESVHSKDFTPEVISNGSVVTLGDFDGIHLGHRKLLNKAKQVAQKEGLPVLLLSYTPSPKVVLGKQKQSVQLLTSDERAALLEEIEIDVLYLYPFTKETTRITAKDFLKDFILNTLKAKHIIIGYDHCFGKNRRGNYRYLKLASARYGFRLSRCSEVSLWGRKISSSSIKESLRAGKVKTASKKLGSFFPVSGSVQKGAQRGSQLGFPTANVTVPKEKILPHDGVYTTITVYQGKKYPSITNIGKNPTFDLEHISVECHIFDFNETIYGETLVIYFVEKIRDEIKFKDINQLKKQIKADCETAQQYLQKRQALLS